MRLMLLTALLVTFVGVGCGRRVPPIARVATPGALPEAVPPPPPPPAPIGAPDSPPAAPPTDDEIFAGKTLAELNAEQPLGEALFDVNQSVLRDDARGALQANAMWLRRWASTRVVVEGHADERGTSEYNLALGQRRAAAVRDYLVDLGIDPDRVALVSKGEESPACTDASEACWQRNRRGAFVITAK
jgi:peptidoglycan-associated lipoprotein